MDKQEFFLLIPGIIYGVAIVDLLKVFTHKNKSFELVGWGVFSLLVITFNWTLLYAQLTLITNNNLNFYLVVFQAIIVSVLTSTISPEEKDIDTKKYFLEIRNSFFLLFAIYMISAIFMRYYVFNETEPAWIRPLGLLIFLICAYTNKYWLRISLLIFASIIMVLRIFSDVI